MPWGTISVVDVESALNAGELAEYRRHVVSVADPLPTITADVIALVRGYLQVRYALTEEGIPDELRSPAIDLVVFRLTKRVGKASEDRQAAHDKAMDILAGASEGKMGDFGGRRASGAYGGDEAIDL